MSELADQVKLEDAYIRFVLDAQLVSAVTRETTTGSAARVVVGSLAGVPTEALAVERRGRVRELWGLISNALPRTTHFLETHTEPSFIRGLMAQYLALEMWHPDGSPTVTGILDSGQDTPLPQSFASTLRRQAEEGTAILRISAALAMAEWSLRSPTGKRRDIGSLEYDLVHLLTEPSSPLQSVRLPQSVNWWLTSEQELHFDGPESLCLAPDIRVLLRSTQLDGYHGECANYMVFGPRVEEVRAAHTQLFDTAGRVDDSDWFSESEGAYRLHEHIYFQETPSIARSDLKLAFSSRTSKRELSLPLDPDRMVIMSELVPMLHERRSPEEIRRALPEQWEFVEQLVTAGIVNRVPTPAPVEYGEYSVLYTAHSCLKFQSPKASLLIDPLLTVRNRPDFDGSHLARDPVDAVVITHSHWDHFNLDSLMLLDRKTQIILPARLHRASVVNLDMRVALKDMGFTNLIELRPWETHQVGDIELTAAPYFGEGHGPEAPTDWLTYLVRLGNKSCLGLVDSCRDDFGSMDEVVRRIRHEHGPVDALFAPCSGYRYPHASYIYRPFYLCQGLGTYTGNHDDVERWSAIAEAKWTIPYALFHLDHSEGNRDAELAKSDSLRFSSSEELANIMRQQPEGPLALMSPGDALTWHGDSALQWQRRVTSADLRSPLNGA